MYNRKYDKVFIMMKQETYGYSDGQKQIAGNVSIEIRNGKGKLSVYVQGLRQLSKGIYKIYLICAKTGIAQGIAACMMEVDGKGQGNSRWEFDVDSVGGSNIPIEEFNVVAVLAEEPGTEANSIIVAPLVGYRDNKINWKDYFVKWKPQEIDKKEEKKQEKEKPDQDPIEKRTSIDQEEKKEELEQRESKEELKVKEEPKQEQKKEIQKETEKKEEPASEEKAGFLKEYLFQEKIGDFQQEKEGTLQTIEIRPDILDQVLKTKEKIAFFHTDKKTDKNSEILKNQEKEKEKQTEKKEKIEEKEQEMENPIPVQGKKEETPQRKELPKQEEPSKDKTGQEFDWPNPAPHDTFKEITMKFKQELEELEKTGIFTPEEIQAIQQMGKKKDNTDLHFIFQNNEKMLPFGKEDKRDWIRICVDEMILLPLESTRLMRHPFLLAGYQKYHHLILGKHKKNGKTQIFLGVPDAYLPEYKQKAAHLGFREFWTQDGKKLPQKNTYGYWIMSFDEMEDFIL